MKSSKSPLTEAPQKQSKWFYGWTIVVVISIISFAGGVETNPVLGVFQIPMTNEFGWSRSLYTMPMSIGSFLGGIGGLIIGPIMDKHGARWVMGIAILIMGLTFILMGFVENISHHFILQILGRTVIASTFFMVVGVVIPKWFITMRGRAIAFANLGQRIGQIAFPVMAERILSFSSWRTAWIAMGFAVWISSLIPTFALLRRKPEDYGLLPDGFDIRNQSSTPNHSYDSEESFNRRMVLKSSAFYLIAIAVCIQSFVTTTIHFHWFSYLTDIGISSSAAVISLSISPFVSMPISIMAGFSAEKIPVQKLMAVSYYFMALSIVLFLYADTNLIAHLFGFAFGISTGVLFTVMNVVWADYFGRNSIGGIRGLVSPAHMLCNSLGPLMAAWSFDLTGSYNSIFIFSACLSALGGSLLLLAKKPQIQR